MRQQKRPPPKRRSFVCDGNLLIEGLEEELNAAEEVLDVVVRAEILAVAIAQRCNDVLERSVVRANFPALCTDDLCIFRAEDRGVRAEVTVSGISAPSALVGCLCTLVVVDDLPSLVEVVCRRVVGISGKQAIRLIELVAEVCGPDVGIVLVVLAVRISFVLFV